MPKTSEASALAHIRRESLDIYNRLHSIEADIAFVNEVRAAYPTFPLIPNLRCGAWYTDPAIAHPSAHAYFKSTDGHHGNWSFNLRRPNIHLLPVIAAAGGLILVDSTRAGKRLPDALSKTVPIWCAVINRATYLRALVERRRAATGTSTPTDIDIDTDEQAGEEDHRSWDVSAGLHTPPGAVGAHEHAQIDARLESWAAALADSSYTLPRLARPLRPLWITPASTRFPHIASDAPFLPVICVSASRAVDAGSERRAGGFSYVQGSGDDHELWGQGLTPQLFWRHRTELLACSREEAEALVVKLVSAARDAGQTSGGDGFHDVEWSVCPIPVLKVGGRVLLCVVADPPRDVDLPASILGSCESDDDDDDDGEIAFIVVGRTSDAACRENENNTERLPAPSQARGEDGPGSVLAESGGTSRVLRLYVPQSLGKRRVHVFVRDVLPRAVSFARSHLCLGRKICVIGGDEGIGVALVLLQLFFDDGGHLCDGTSSRIVTRKSSVRTRLEWIIASQPQVNPARAILKSVNTFLLS